MITDGFIRRLDSYSYRFEVEIGENMRTEFRTLRTKQLEKALEVFAATTNSSRPQKGWLRAIREATGISLREMATRLKKTPTLAAKLEKSEAQYRITLASLRDAADALGCQLVYALVPKSGSIQDLAEHCARMKAAENVRAEHSMALEDHPPAAEQWLSRCVVCRSASQCQSISAQDTH